MFLHVGNCGTELTRLIRDHTSSMWATVILPALLTDQDDPSWDMAYIYQKETFLVKHISLMLSEILILV